LECPVGGFLSVRSSLVIYQFGELLSTVELPGTWREAIAERCRTQDASKDVELEHIFQRRRELEEEQKRLVTVYTKGYLSEQALDSRMEQIRQELLQLPLPIVPTADEVTQAALSSGETLMDMASYWSEAIAEERRDMVWALLELGGLVYDLERRCIMGLLPRGSMLPVLGLGLEKTGHWEQRDRGLWLRADYLPPKQVREEPHLPPPQPPSLTPEEQVEALALVQAGVSLRQIAKHFETSHGAIWRLVRRSERE